MVFHTHLVHRSIDSESRNGQPGSDIDDINDIRNGLFLGLILYTALGLGQVAFLKVRFMIIEQEC